jgi:hypothetical protein
VSACSCRRAAPVRYRFSAAVATAGATAVVVGVLAFLTGGRLATGPFDPVRLPVELLVPAVLLWVGVPIMLVAVLRSGAEAAPSVAGTAGADESAGEPPGAGAEEVEERDGDADADRADGDSEGERAGDDVPGADADSAEAGGGRPDDEAAGGDADAGGGNDQSGDPTDGEQAETSTGDGDEPAGRSPAPAGAEGAPDEAASAGDGGGEPEEHADAGAGHQPDRRGNDISDRAAPRRVPAARRSPEPAGRPRRRRWWQRAEPEVEEHPAVPEQRGPQTVAELVAQRAEEAAEREAGERGDGST